MTDFAFLHGGGQGSWVWDETIAAMQAQSGGAARCLALDVPGCGTKRGRDTSAIVFADIARELIADLTAASMRDIVLVGHSQAGTILPLMAEFAPLGLIRRLIFVACIAPGQGKTMMEKMGSGLHGTNPDEVGWPVDPATSTSEERFGTMFCNDMSAAEGDAFMAMLGKDMWPACSYTQRDWRFDHLAAIPSSLVLCLQDMCLPPAWQERFALQLHCDRTVKIDAGHQVMNTRPHGLAEILLAEAAG